MPSCSVISIVKRKRAIRQWWKLRGDLSLPLLATNGVCHASRAQREVTDVFTCIRNHVRLETAGRLLANKFRALSEIAEDDEAALCRSA